VTIEKTQVFEHGANQTEQTKQTPYQTPYPLNFEFIGYSGYGFRIDIAFD
jgi:hypothetical protein